RVDVLDFGMLQVLRLYAVAAPAARTRAMIPKRAPDPIIIIAARQQRGDLFRRGLPAALPYFQHPADRNGQVLTQQQLDDVIPVQRANAAALLAQPLLESGDLVDAGDGSARDVRHLRIKLGSGGLGEGTCGLGELAVDVETARIDPLIELPDAELFVRQ